MSTVTVPPPPADAPPELLDDVDELEVEDDGGDDDDFDDEPQPAIASTVSGRARSARRFMGREPIRRSASAA
jgi:hypothetical protein